ncbi:MAG: ribbon-helix-helix protein, CopG family [Cyanobacteria bacterium P01_F01_bin.143]
MKNIPIDQLEKKIEAGEEVIDTYFDAATTRIGTPHQVIARRKDIVTTNLNFPSPMLNELDEIAKELNISREAVIKMMLRRALDEHYMAKNKLKY